MKRKGVLGVAVLALGSVVAGWAPGQVGRLPILPVEQSYRVRFVNEMGYPIRIKMVRYGAGRYLEEDLPRNASVQRDLYAGERVLCVWNREERLTLAAQVDVDTSGTLRIRPIDYAAAEAGPLSAPRGAASRPSLDPLPRLQLDP